MFNKNTLISECTSKLLHHDKVSGKDVIITYMRVCHFTLALIYLQEQMKKRNLHQIKNFENYFDDSPFRSFMQIKEPKVLKRPKQDDKMWIKQKEINSYVSLLSLFNDDIIFIKNLGILGHRIARLVKRSGWTFAFLYLKECYRLVMWFLAGTPETKSPGKGLLVRRSPNGLPSILPLNLQSFLLNWKENIVNSKIILSCLSIYRVFPTKPKISLSTITEPFTGITESLPVTGIKISLREFYKGKIKCLPAKLINQNSAGPNLMRGTYGAPFDALAFLHEPIVLFNYVSLCLSTKNFYIIWQLFCCIFIGIIPYISVLLLYGTNKRFKLGKFSIVYDQAGKARVIGIISYWHQLLLKPLHDSLFKILKSMDTDGTFDQSKPLDRICEKETEEKYFSFDLSAATDRLPLKLQTDILNILSGCNLGTLWAKILAIEWHYKDRKSVV